MMPPTGARCELPRTPSRRSSPVKPIAPVQTDQVIQGDQPAHSQNRCTCLYSTLHTHPRSHRLWSVFPAHDVLATRVAVSQGDTMQHPAYRLRRIPLPRTPVNRLICSEEHVHGEMPVWQT